MLEAALICWIFLCAITLKGVNFCFRKTITRRRTAGSRMSLITEMQLGACAHTVMPPSMMSLAKKGSPIKLKTFMF